MLSQLSDTAVFASDGFKPSDVDRGAGFMNSPFQNFEMETVLSNSLFVLARVGDDWAGFTWEDYQQTCEHRVTHAELRCLNAMVDLQWLTVANEKFTPTETFIDYVRKNDLRVPSVQEAKKVREAKRREWLDGLRPVVDERTRAALEFIDGLSSTEDVRKHDHRVRCHMSINVNGPWPQPPRYEIEVNVAFYDDFLFGMCKFEIPSEEYRIETLRAKLREEVNKYRVNWELPEVLAV